MAVKRASWPEKGTETNWSDQIPSISYYRHATEDKGYLQNPGRLDLLPSEVLRAIWTLADRLEAVFGSAL